LRTGDPGKLPPPVENYRESLPRELSPIINRLEVARAVGGPAKIREKIARFAERTGADEIITSGAIFDPEARCRARSTPGWSGSTSAPGSGR
jgi:alkanesulfonate monooxygenase SsuD/methylene tetrahydromethanopterin reductase-like flavin-dependent oxidoreductase (luciferase family)